MWREAAQMGADKEPIRVLNVVGLMSPGGIETLIMNIYRNIDREKVQFDFLTHKGIDGVFDKEIKELGGRIYKMPCLRDGNRTYYSNAFKYIRELKRFFKEHPEYHVIHGHMTNTAAIYMPIAKKYGHVTCCIAHSHLTEARPGLSGFVTDLRHKPLPRIATDYFACSEMAAHWIFPDEAIRSGKVKIIKNGVDPKKFYYDPQVATDIKDKLGLTGKVVIGNVARFKTEKNHTFQIDIMNELIKKEPRAVLMLVGDGELRGEMEKKVHTLGLDENVKFMGLRSDVAQLMNAMDLFLLPSLYEGLPVVGIEAQAASLPVITSTGVTTEMDITGNVEFMDLSAGAEKWADAIAQKLKSFQRKDMYSYIKENGYDITETAKWLQDFYISKHAGLS